MFHTVVSIMVLVVFLGLSIRRARTLIIIYLSALMITATMFSAPVSAGKLITATPTDNFTEQAVSASTNFTEQAAVVVNCSSATLVTSIALMSLNETFVHCPSGVNMMDTNFELCTSVLVLASPKWSALIYVFNTTDETVARGYADAITPSISGAFSLSFSFYSIGLTSSETNVTYTAPAITNVLSYYTNTLKPSCLKSDLAGFSSAIPNLLNVLPSNSYVGITAQKNSGSYAWEYTFFAGYQNMQIPTGSGYTINVLNLLGAASLSPSQYAYTGVYYNSIASVTIQANTTVSFVSCTPASISTPFSPTRGWYVVPSNPLTTGLTGIFFFGNDATPVTALTFTFSGTIAPEFSSLTLIITIIVCTIGIAIAFRRRFLKVYSKHAPPLQ